jgi:hypothetical protein
MVVQRIIPEETLGFIKTAVEKIREVSLDDVISLLFPIIMSMVNALVDIIEDKEMKEAIGTSLDKMMGRKIALKITGVEGSLGMTLTIVGPPGWFEFGILEEGKEELTTIEINLLDLIDIITVSMERGDINLLKVLWAQKVKIIGTKEYVDWLLVLRDIFSLPEGKIFEALLKAKAIDSINESLKEALSKI